MNWEVWTMPRKTSCCNGTLLRSDVRHYWPAGFLYVLVWLMILPIPLLQTARDYLRFQSEQTVQLAAQLHNHVYAAMTGSLVLAVLAGAVIPMAVYAYLMTPRAVGLMHALPVTRTSQFFTHFLSGFGLLTAGNLLIFLLSALAMMPSGSVDWAALGLWLLVTELLELFFLSLGALCAMATGWLLAIPVLYGAANCIVLLVCVVVQFLQRWFYFGFESTTFPMAVIWLTPIARLSTAVCGYADVLVTREGEEVYLRVLPEGGMTSLLVYAIVGLALLTSLHCPEDHPFLGKSLAQIAALTGQDPLDCCCDLLVREDCQITMIDFMASEEDIIAILQSDLSNLISDSTYPTEGMPHPRVYGTFPRLIQHFVMKKHALTLEQAVRKMTALPARALRLRHKGVIAEGMDADLCVFDPAQLRENGDYRCPCRMASGLDAVLVAGQPAVIHDTLTGAHAGTVIRRELI